MTYLKLKLLKKRIRQPGGGRKRYDETHPGIDQKFLEVLKYDTAGDPMDETVRWTNLRPWEIAQRLAQRYELKVSRTVIRQLLKKHHYRRRHALKKQTLKTVPHRNDQFENIARLIADYQKSDNPQRNIWATSIGRDVCIPWNNC